ncbi:A/G-specific adenine glycosylase [Chloroflexota bacterium]
MNPFASDLLSWFASNAADLPWRHNREPYRVWLSEVMLQQTQVGTVIGYYERFLAAYPTVEALAAASLDDVLKLWAGLGYYSRARNLHRTAQIVVADRSGCFPETASDLQTLPGIGRYTAGAIASLAFGEDVPVVDGNVIRILTRLYDIDTDVTLHRTKQQLWELAETLVPVGQAGSYNEALMELGRVICKPRQPLCMSCPIRNHCSALAAGVQEQRPVKKKRESIPHYDVAAGVIHGRDQNEGLILIAQRPLGGLLGGLWEFPGGKKEDGETMPETLARELEEELNITVEVGEFLLQIKHAFTHFKITLHAYECLHVSGEPETRDVADFAWVTMAQMADYAFGKADQTIVAALLERPRHLL